MKRRLFISQPFTGYSEEEIKKQREALVKLFISFSGETPSNVELIEQITPDDPFDVRENFRSDKEQDFYHFCRSIGMLGKATDIILYGDWEKSRGCNLEVEILGKYGINFIDQKLLIAFCVRNNMLEPLEALWPEEADLLRKMREVKMLPTTMMTVPAVTAFNVSDNEIVISHESSLPHKGKIHVLRYPTNGTILELNIRVRNEYEFPLMDSHPELVYVSPNNSSKLMMDMDQWGDILTVIISDADPDEPSEEEIQNVLEGSHPLCVIKDGDGGIYSGGKYTAWCCEAGFMPDDISVDEVRFSSSTWDKLKEDRKKGEAIYGIGETPDEARRDLAKAMIRNSKIQNEEE